jgi:aspartate/methionine/tyrosine aminotransferase
LPSPESERIVPRADEAQEVKGVALGVDFGQAGKRAVRFSYASSEENIREAARRLAEYLGRR